MANWLVVDGEDGHKEAVYVEAETEQDAALEGLFALMAEVDYDEPPRLVAVVPADGRVLYLAQLRPERAELQCCGGWRDHEDYVPTELGGHTATCPTVERHGG